MSKLIEKYNSSPFANIGKKVSQIKEMSIGNSGLFNKMHDTNVQNSKLANLHNMPPTDIKVTENLRTMKSMDLTGQQVPLIFPLVSEKIVNQSVPILNFPNDTNLLNSSIETIVIKPYGTLLVLNSIFGNIIVKPYKSLIKLFNSISEAKFIIIGKNSRLVNSPIDKIEDFSFHSKLFELNSKYDDLIEMTKTSVLSFKWPNTVGMESSSVLTFKRPSLSDMLKSSVLSSKLAKIKAMIFGSVLTRNSIFDDLLPMDKSNVMRYYQSTLDFRSDSVLSQESMSSILDELKIESVLDYDSPNLIIKDIKLSLLNVLNTSGKNLFENGSTMPFTNLFPDVNATGFTLKAGLGITLFDMGKIPLRLQPGPFWENADVPELKLDGTFRDSLGKLEAYPAKL